MTDQYAKYMRFKALHAGDKAFVVGNAWDAGSARILASAGFEALATTSAGYAFSVGKRDSYAALGRDEMLANAAAIVAATDLPVSADLEDGYGTLPETCAQTIEMAAAVGLVGGSIEDATGDPDQPIHAFDLAVERVRAAAETAKHLPFVLTARAENFLWGRPDLEDTVERLKAYADAGAEVLFAPGLPDLATIARVCREVGKPVNVVMGLSGAAWSVADLSAAGVRRISVGGSFARSAYGALRRAAEEVLGEGTFSYRTDAISHAEMGALMGEVHAKSRA